MSKAVEALTSKLLNHIKSGMAELVEVYPEWPEANQTLAMPALTAFSNAPKFTNLDPYPLTFSGINASNQIVTDYVVGQYDLAMQIDLWCRNKHERDTVWEKLFQTLNPKIVPMGLSLQLDEYFGVWARYDIAGFSFDDSEAVAQRREWRVKVDLLAHCKAVLSATDYAMTTIEKTVETTDTE